MSAVHPIRSTPITIRRAVPEDSRICVDAGPGAISDSMVSSGGNSAEITAAAASTIASPSSRIWLRNCDCNITAAGL